MVTVPDVNGCALCPVPEAGHPVQGFGHMDDTKKKLTTTKDFVAPSPDLIARRQRARTAGGYEIAETHPVTGEPTTHFVRSHCRCGATALATLEHASNPRCSSCIRDDIDGAS